MRYCQCPEMTPSLVPRFWTIRTSSSGHSGGGRPKQRRGMVKDPVYLPAIVPVGSLNGEGQVPVEIAAFLLGQGIA